MFWSIYGKDFKLFRKYKLRRKYKKYFIMKKEGKSDREIFLTAKADGFNGIKSYEILCNICGLSFGDAKEIVLCTNSDCSTISEYQEKYVLPALEEAFELEAQEKKRNEENNKHNAQ